MKRPPALGSIVRLAAFTPWLAAGSTVAVKEARGAPPESKKEAQVKEAKCFECHDGIEALKKGSKHGKVNCVSCHTGTAAHLADSDKRPGTRVDHEACGACPKDPYETFTRLTM